MSNAQRYILVVEDDLDGQVLMTTLLEHSKMEVDVAANAAEAEALLSEHGSEYDAVIIDLALPDMDGWQLLSEIQANPVTAELMCIAVTAYHSSKLREKAILSGFKAYFAKPIDSTSFLRELTMLL